MLKGVVQVSNDSSVVWGKNQREAVGLRRAFRGNAVVADGLAESLQVVRRHCPKLQANVRPIFGILASGRRVMAQVGS
jgi:hypothetical protein